MSEEELAWYESPEGMQQFLESVSSPRLIGLRAQLEKFGAKVSPLFFLDETCRMTGFEVVMEGA